MEIGKLFIIVGVSSAVLGAVILYFPQLITWFGRLPGDIRYRNENVTFYLPVVSSIVISIVVSLILALMNRGR